MRSIATLAALLTTSMLAGGPIDDPVKRPNGPFPHHHRCHALIGADVVTAPGERLEDATIILRDGHIEAVGVDLAIPADARLWPMDEHVIYAGFIEPAATTSIESPASGLGSHWNDSI
ncbi:MAG: hypothetical protein HOL13_08905, partial [Phycisphaerae bacterium]|nr:hypothetical protein [Phycisphaerae bacterium]